MTLHEKYGKDFPDYEFNDDNEVIPKKDTKTVNLD
jgi:hypothetical protein